MAKVTSAPTSGIGANADGAMDGTANNTIEALLQQRTQYEQWLARLDTAVENVPSAVRERVRGDYEDRLRRVIDDLRGHAATIAHELEHHRAIERELSADRQQTEEALAEAEVRHIVGEYGDEDWERLSGESERRLEGLRGELQSVGAEIARLAEVQTLIAAPSPARTKEAVAPVAPPAPAPRPVAADPVPVQAQLEIAEPLPIPTPVAATPTPVVRPATDTSTPVRPVERQSEPTTVPVDELAFLKSVSDDERKPAAPAPAPRRSMPGAAAGPGVGGSAKLAPAEPAPAVASTATGAGKTAGMAKTLKCNECGTFNRPTEWYCERCGAELAAL